MEVLPGAMEQRLVGDLLDERMLEGVSDGWEMGYFVKELSGLQGREAVMERLLGQRRNGAGGVQARLSRRPRRSAGAACRRGEPVDAGGQDRLDGVWNGQRCGGPASLVLRASSSRKKDCPLPLS